MLFVSYKSVATIYFFDNKNKHNHCFTLKQDKEVLYLKFYYNLEGCYSEIKYYH